ncbi:MAG TPA: alpha-xenorhabdolysin family binary toxin subunit A [Actinomycetota bacterium]|nr:alpha-xenorhabdolysin family binary toxin subunit A [Actinomycetota bacterium]
MTSQLSIAPGAIAVPGTEGGPGFALSKPEWIAVQTFVTNGLALPTNDTEFRNSLGAGAPSSLADFQRLITCYQSIYGHCTTWQGDTFPKSVTLASEVYEYGTSKAPVFYPPILKEADILSKNPGDDGAKEALKAILDNLSQTAGGYATRAADVQKDIQAFADGTAADQTTLIGPDGQGGLLKYYNDKYGSASAEVEALTKDIAAQRIVLQSANDEYDHDVIVAATTPTYAWVWPIGTIAAAVVAGIYGDKAVKARERAQAAQGKIDTLTDQLTADANLMTAIHSATFGLTSISGNIAAALPVIQKIQGVWGGIADDLKAIVRLIDVDIRQVPPIIMGLGVDEAMKAWFNVAQAANAYRLNAYVTEQPGAESMALWKVRTQLSSARLRAA